MKVKELILELQKFDQEADVCVEAWQDAWVNEVKQYNYPEEKDAHVVYIGDSLQYLDENLI